MPGIFDSEVFDEVIFDTLFWRIIKGIVTLRFAGKVRILDFVDKEKTLYLSAKEQILDLADKIKTLRFGRKGT